VRISDNVRASTGRVRFGHSTPPPAEALQIHSRDWTRTEATRYICATAHLDAKFRSQVLQRFLQNRYNAHGVSCGFDPTAVLKHCIAAKAKDTLRDWIFAGVVFVAILASLLALARGKIYAPFLYLCVVTAAGGILFARMRWTTRYDLIPKRLTRRTFDPNCVEIVPDAKLQKVIKRLSDEQKGNLVVHSGFSPFVGSGVNVGGWSLAIDHQKRKEHLLASGEPAPFQIAELYTELCADLRALKIGNLTIEDKLYVNGEDLENSPRFLPAALEPPATDVDPAFLDSVANNPASTQVRHYKEIRLVNWGGDLVLTIFLRLAKPGRNLFVEGNYYLLTPVADRYRTVDNLPASPTFGEGVGLVLVSFIKAGFAGVFWPLVLLGRLAHAWEAHERRVRMRKLVQRNLAFNRGATSSLREDVSTGNYRRFFQKLDKEMHVKIVERQIFDTIIRFLDARNIDTSDLIERRTTIMNSGVIVSGQGSLTAENVAVGQQAKAVKKGLTLLKRAGTGVAGGAAGSQGASGGE
jgi:hypothetical protein